jgi:hypothetical protein
LPHRTVLGGDDGAVLALAALCARRPPCRRVWHDGAGWSGLTVRQSPASHPRPPFRKCETLDRLAPGMTQKTIARACPQRCPRDRYLQVPGAL